MMDRARLQDPLEDGESFYVVFPQMAPFRREEWHNDVVTVRAMSEEDAVAQAHGKIMAEVSDVDPDYLDTMFVIAYEPEDVHTFLRGVKYDPCMAEFECCGGNSFTGNGHAATCVTLRQNRE